MNSSQRTIVVLLVVIAFMAGWIASGSLRASPLPSLAGALLPSAQAGQVPINVDRDFFVTASEDGSRIYVWRLGSVVNGHYDSATARTFYATGGRN